MIIAPLRSNCWFSLPAHRVLTNPPRRTRKPKRGWYGWPKTYRGWFAVTAEGLRIRAEPPTQKLANAVPRVTIRNGEAGPVFGQGVVPWLAG
jgi:hypothetical protein